VVPLAVAVLGAADHRRLRFFRFFFFGLRLRGDS
jgi:hypothetical protein